MSSNQNPEDGSIRIINIAVLNETDLLSMIKGYVNAMTEFAKKTRNVHKELKKDTLTNTGMVLQQYLKIKGPIPKEKENKSASTHTEEVPINTPNRSNKETKNTYIHKQVDSKQGTTLKSKLLNYRFAARNK